MFTLVYKIRQPENRSAILTDFAAQCVGLYFEIMLASPTAFQAAAMVSGCLTAPASPCPSKINALQNNPRLTKPNKSLAPRPKPAYNARLLGQIAQSVEQRIENPCVGSSILPLATKLQPEQQMLFGLFCFALFQAALNVILC